MIQMGVTNSVQVCMDATHWLEHDDDSGGMDTHTTTSSLIMERRLRPQHEQRPGLKCPRCDSAHTKFCYYNNYSHSQPRYFCKTCRRCWTKGGTLRSIPVGGGCRKNKKVSSSSSSSKKATDNPNLDNSHSPNPTHLQLSFPHDHMHFTSHINTLLSSNPSSFFSTNPPSSFMELAKFGSAPIDFLDSKLGPLVGSSNTPNNNYDFLGNNNNNVINQGQFGDFNGFGQSNFNLPYFGVNNNSMIIDQPSFIMEQQISYNHGSVDVKPNPKNMLMLEWPQGQNCADVGKRMMMMMMNGTTSNNIINGYNNFSSSLGSSWTVNMMNDLD